MKAVSVRNSYDFSNIHFDSFFRIIVACIIWRHIMSTDDTAYKITDWHSNSRTWKFNTTNTRTNICLRSWTTSNHLATSQIMSLYFPSSCYLSTSLSIFQVVAFQVLIMFACLFNPFVLHIQPTVASLTTLTILCGLYKSRSFSLCNSGIAHLILHLIDQNILITNNSKHSYRLLCVVRFYSVAVVDTGKRGHLTTSTICLVLLGANWTESCVVEQDKKNIPNDMCQYECSGLTAMMWKCCMSEAVQRVRRAEFIMATTARVIV
jgi:hypothetical protein